MANHGPRIDEHGIPEDYISPDYGMWPDDAASADLDEFADDCVGGDKREKLNSAANPFDNTPFRAWSSNRNNCKIARLKLEVTNRPDNSIIAGITLKRCRVVVKIACNPPRPLALGNTIQMGFQFSAKISCPHDIQVSLLHLPAPSF